MSHPPSAPRDTSMVSPTSPTSHPQSSLVRPRTEETGSQLSAPPGLTTAHPSRRDSRLMQDVHFPVYQNNYPVNYPRMQDIRAPADSGPQSTSPTHRGSDVSEDTLAEAYNPADITYHSYRHPYDIQPPPKAANLASPSTPFGHSNPGGKSYYEDNTGGRGFDEDIESYAPPSGERRRGLFSNILQLYNVEKDDEDEGMSHIRDFDRRQSGAHPWGFRRIDSLASDEDQVIDPDDPTVTGERKRSLEDQEDIEKNVLREMSYKERRKERQRLRVEFNVTSVQNRQTFLMTLAKALMTYGAPSHRIESQLLSAARILEVDAEFVHIPGIIICSFGDHDTKTTETHFVKCGGSLALGRLHEVHQVYRSVVHDEVSARKATAKLEELIEKRPIYNIFIRCVLAFFISSLICPLAFAGSFVDMWISGLGAVILTLVKIATAHKGELYTTVFDVSVTIFISFIARVLSNVSGQIFCYTAISSAGIVGILPGYLILTSSLELASKNIVTGSVKMVYALIYTLYIGFGLQFGSDLYLLFNHAARDDLTTTNMDVPITLSGHFMPDNSSAVQGGSPLAGQVTFSPFIPVIHENIIMGCYRPPNFPWYLQTFPWWSQFIIVPIFSLLSSLNNLQPWKSWDLLVMCVISCISYASNKIADHFIFQRSDVVSAIGAFVVGLLGNMYSRKMGGTAFTSMVTGVLFMVPSGLSQAGGITAQGNGLAIGNAMIAVTIGITVGLFMSQTIVYMFGTRKNAAIFSF